MRTHPCSAPVAFAFLASLGLGSCGGGGAGGDTGGMSLALTDAASDELDQFEVDVHDVELMRLDGGTVAVLTRRARVDFAQLQEVSELIAAPALPVGTYTGLRMTLDFATAAVLLKGSATPATVVDQTGAPITGDQVVTVRFASTLRPSIAVRRNRLFVLDLDLDQSVTPDLPGNRVTFVPALTATVDATNPKPVAVQGILRSVDAARRTFTLERVDASNQALALVTVTGDNLTLYQVDGVAAQGAAGLAALAALPVDSTRVFAQGVLNRNTGVLAAVAVEAGAGTFGNGQDWVEGHIVARDHSAGQDATLTVRGRSLTAATGARRYDTTFAVGVFHGVTQVLRRGVNTSLGTDDLAVGQRVLCFGTLTGTSLDCTAATGVVRCLKTSVFGIAAGAPSNNVLTVAVNRFDLRDVSQFQFTVGGIVEADAAAFTVDVTGLATAGVSAGSRLQVQGFLNPVGVVGDANSQAVSLTNRQSAARLLVVTWPTNAGATISAASSSGLTLEVSGAVVKGVFDGFSPVALSAAPAPQVTPPSSLGVYRLVQAGQCALYVSFDSFVAALAELRGGGAHVVGVSALGTYTALSQTLIAPVVTVFLQ